MMTIPDYQSIMLALHKLTADKQEHKILDLAALLADQFALSFEKEKYSFPAVINLYFITAVAGLELIWLKLA